LKKKQSKASNGIRISSNPKSTPLYSGIKVKNIRRRRKWRPYDGHDKPLINDIFNQLANKQIRVETPDGQSKTVSKYYQRAQYMLNYIYTTGIANPFVISMSDLDQGLIITLVESSLKDILGRVVERIIENCGSDLLRANKKSSFKRYPWLMEM